MRKAVRNALQRTSDNLGAMVEYHPTSKEDKSRLHQFGPKVLPGMFLGYVLYAGIWKGDIMIADIEELEEMDASELHARRLNAKEVLTPMKGDNFRSPVADGTVTTLGGDRSFRPSTLIRDHPEQGEEQEVFEEHQTDSLLQRLFKMTQHGTMRKPEMISGLLREILFVALTRNPESNCTCRKNHFLFR